jgi:hypothetical protein
MATKRDEARMRELENMVDRLATRLKDSQNRVVLLQRQLEIMQEDHQYDDDQIDAVRRRALKE